MNKQHVLKPRGFFTNKYPWTKDTTKEYYEGDRLQIYWPLAKTLMVISLLLTLHLVLGFGLLLTIFICVIITSFYQDVVAMIVPNTIRIPPMD